MNISALYTSFEGRIPRKSFWLGTIVLAVVMIVLLFGSLAAVGERDFAALRLNGLVITILFLYPLLAIWVKRLHDRGRPGYAVLFFIIPWGVHQLTNVMGITGDPFNVTSLDVLFFAINILIGIWFVIDLGILRGTRGANSYGADPAAPATS